MISHLAISLKTRRYNGIIGQNERFVTESCESCNIVTYHPSGGT